MNRTFTFHSENKTMLHKSHALLIRLFIMSLLLLVPVASSFSSLFADSPAVAVENRSYDDFFYTCLSLDCLSVIMEEETEEEECGEEEETEYLNHDWLSIYGIAETERSADRRVGLGSTDFSTFPESLVFSPKWILFQNPRC